jgi:hypothetical protein
MIVRPDALIPGVLAAALLVACGGGGSVEPAGIEGSPAAAVGQLLETINDREWSREWQSLHPEQQSLVPRDRFVSCSKKASSPEVVSFKVLEVNDQEMAIPGTDKRAAGKAVTAEYAVMSGSQPSKAVDTFYLFDVDGSWRWVLSNSSVERYASGSCPA